MKVYNLTENSTIYTSNVFYLLGEWNTLDDVSTLIDVGSDSKVIETLEGMNSGLGKKKIDQVIITHNHSDHVAMLQLIIEQYHPKVYARDSNLKGVDYILSDGDKLRFGELEFEVFHITVHSSDSIVLFCEQEGILFAGDTNFPIEFENTALKFENKYVLSRIDEKKVKVVYSGHGSVQKYNSTKFKLLK